MVRRTLSLSFAQLREFEQIVKEIWSESALDDSSDDFLDSTESGRASMLSTLSSPPQRMTGTQCFARSLLMLL